MKNLLEDFHWEVVESPVLFVPNLRELGGFMIQGKGSLDNAPRRFIVGNPSIN